MFRLIDRSLRPHGTHAMNYFASFGIFMRQGRWTQTPLGGVLLENLAGNMQHALSTSLTHQVKRLINIKVIIEMITKGKVSFF